MRTTAPALLLSASASALHKGESVVYGDAVSKANTSAVVYLGQFKAVADCETAANAERTATAFSWFDPAFNHADAKWASGCYARTDGKYTETAKKLVTSGRTAPTPPAPPPTPSPAGSCQTDTDCSLNGLCTDGACVCDAAWTGDKCASFALLPAERNSGYRILDDPLMGNTSSWGGGGFYDATDKKWYMFATELAEHCGMHTWTTNSQTVRASCASGTGLYKREAVVVPIWSHESAVTRGPNGEYVAFFSYNADEGKSRPVCHLCTDGSTNPGCKNGDGAAPLGIENTDPTFMSWTATATGNWSKPVMVLGPTVQMDTNMAAVIKADGSLIGQWRDHHPGGKHSTPHLVTATNWKDPASYTYFHEDLLFGKGKNPGGVEDMFLWRDKRGHYHSVYHQMYDCETCTAHAFSSDGIKWTYTGTAAPGLTEYNDGTKFDFTHSERPHVLFDESGTKPIALTNGVKIQGLSNNDQSFTLLRPLRLTQ